MTFEQLPGRGEKVSSALIDRAYERAISGKGQEQIDMDDFFDHYGHAAVVRDKERIAELEEKFDRGSSPEDQEAKKLATVLEAIVIEQLELSEWFGPSVHTYRTTSFDDVRNGIDAIIDIEREEVSNYVAVGVDVTYTARLQEKFRRVQEEIDAGTLATVKYFKNAEGTFTGRLSKIPRVILGMDKGQLVGLVELWVNGKKKEMATHRAQFQLLEEMKIQLEAFKGYAERLGKTDLAKIYDRQLSIVKSIIRERRTTMIGMGVDIPDTPENDLTFNAIQEWARYFENLEPAK